jgi:hypothetical protein
MVPWDMLLPKRIRHEPTAAGVRGLLAQQPMPGMLGDLSEGAVSSPSFLGRLGRGILGRIGQIPSRMAGVQPGTDPEIADAMRRQAMLGFGSAMLQQGGTPFWGRVGGALPMAQAAGQGAYQQAQAQQQQAQAQQMMGLLGQLGTDPTSIRRGVMGLLATGNPQAIQAAQTLQGMLPDEGSFAPIPEGSTNILDKSTGRVIPISASQQAAVQQMPLRVQGMALDELNRFNNRVSPIVGADSSYKAAQELAAQIRANPSEAGPQAVGMLYGFIRQLDPGSVVREGEIGLVSGATGAITNLENLLTRWRQGGFSLRMVDSIMEAAGALNAANQRAYDRIFRNSSRSFRAVTGYELPTQESPFTATAPAAPPRVTASPTLPPATGTGSRRRVPVPPPPGRR